MNVQSKKEAEGKVSLTHDTHMMRTVTECFTAKFAEKMFKQHGQTKCLFYFILTLERHDRNRNCKRKEIYVRLI